MSDDFYRRLNEKQEKDRTERIFKDRPNSLHDYQGCVNDPVHMRKRIEDLEKTNFNLRRAYHNASGHNQFFERCEDPYCNPNPTLSCAFSGAADTSMTPGDRAKVEYIANLEARVNRLQGILTGRTKEETAENIFSVTKGRMNTRSIHILADELFNAAKKEEK